MKILIPFLMALLFTLPAFAQSIPDAEVEMRAREIGRSLRCVVCQNQSIDESDASLAQDMRKLVRTRIRAGDGNQQVIDYMQTRYGDFVLLKPPVQANTYILWFAPAGMLIVFLGWYVVRARRTPDQEEPRP